MKSLGLALTIFILTGALAALDLSGAHRVPASTLEVAQPSLDNQAARAVASARINLGSEEADDDESEAEPEILNAFLVTTRPLAAVKLNAATALRYD